MLPASDCALGNLRKLNKKSDGRIDTRHKIGSRQEIDLRRKQTAPTPTKLIKQHDEVGEQNGDGSEICEVVMNIKDDLPILRYPGCLVSPTGARREWRAFCCRSIAPDEQARPVPIKIWPDFGAARAASRADEARSTRTA
jgi:hypothetical protein